jgi:hypothetical protein
MAAPREGESFPKRPFSWFACSGSIVRFETVRSSISECIGELVTAIDSQLGKRGGEMALNGSFRN